MRRPFLVIAAMLAAGPSLAQSAFDRADDSVLSGGRDRGAADIRPRDPGPLGDPRSAADGFSGEEFDDGRVGPYDRDDRLGGGATRERDVLGDGLDLGRDRGLGG